jgi:acyl carrier protein
MAKPEIFTGVKECLALALGIDKDEVTLDASFADMGTESIDMLDVIFRIEDKFGITTSMEELRARLLGSLKEEEFFNDNRMITDSRLQRLQKAFPDLDLGQFEEPVGEEILFSLFTVHHLVELVEEKLAQGPGRGE